MRFLLRYTLLIMNDSNSTVDLNVRDATTKEEHLMKAGAARASAENKRRSARFHLDLAANPFCAYGPGHTRIAADLEADALVDLAFAEACERWALEAA